MSDVKLKVGDRVRVKIVNDPYQGTVVGFEPPIQGEVTHAKVVLEGHNYSSVYIPKIELISSAPPTPKEIYAMVEELDKASARQAEATAKLPLHTDHEDWLWISNQVIVWGTIARDLRAQIKAALGVE